MELLTPLKTIIQKGEKSKQTKSYGMPDLVMWLFLYHTLDQSHQRHLFFKGASHFKTSLKTLV